MSSSTLPSKPIGIVRYGAYLPKYLLSREQISTAWDFPMVPGTIAVGNNDEDPISMAVEAGIDCLGTLDPKLIDGLFFATTTSPYTEKQSATIIASVLDLRAEISTMDITDSIRGLSTALIRAVESIKSGSAHKILVIGADMQVPMPESMFEFEYGDGAVAFLIGDTNVVITIESMISLTDNVTGPWKRAKDPYIRHFEPKHENEYGFRKNLVEAIQTLLTQSKSDPKSIRKAAIYSPDPRAGGQIATQVGVPSQAVEDSPFLEIGNTGNAFAGMTLINALRRGRTGDLVLFASYGDGADALLLKIQDKAALKALKTTTQGVQGYQRSMVPLRNYPAFLSMKKKLEKERYTRKSSPVRLWREEMFLLRLYGMKCTKCGTIQYPIWRSCIQCGAKDQRELLRLKRTGTIFTYVLDHLVGGEYAATPVPRCVIDLDGGGRILCDMTDVENPSEIVKIGMPVELTFRWIHPGAQCHNYYWKCRPPRVKTASEEEGESV